MRYLIPLVCLFLIVSCRNEGVEKQVQPVIKEQAKVDTLDMKHAIHEVKKLDNGIEISWVEKGKGELLQDGDVVLIDYKVRLLDSTIIDGNHLLNKESLPYIIGFDMQPAGWDLSLKEMRVGDFAYVKIPSKLVRGKKGINGLIPNDADNYLAIRVLSKEKPTREVDGNKVWIFEKSPKSKEKFNEDNTIVFHAMASSHSSPLYFNSYRTNTPFQLKLEDNGVVPGLKKALINAKKGDRMFVLVPSEQAYGSKGYLDIVKPNEDLFFNVFVMDILK